MLQNLFLVVLLLFGVAMLFSGGFLIFRNFFRLRFRVRRSLETELEVIKVSKVFKQNEDPEGEKWKEEIGSMEQFLTSLANIKQKKSLLEGLFGENPSISFEIANPSNSEEIFFYLAIPRHYRETIEKQIHSFFPKASVEKISDYTIFTSKSYVHSSTLKLKATHALPLRTYETMEVDPLNEISNALSKLETVDEGASMQLILVPAGKTWRSEGREIAHKMQQGKQLKEVYRKSMAGKVLKEGGKMAGDIIHTAVSKKQEGANLTKEKTPVQLTPEEQELIKAIEGKTHKAGFYVNIRLLASARSQERAEEILSQLENAFTQFQNADINYFKIKKRLKKKEFVYDYIFRSYNRDEAIILNTEEIASIFHFPISTTETPKIKWQKAGSAPAPVNIPQDGLVLGYNDYRGAKTKIKLAENDRRRHLYVIGQTGTGKSNFLKEMAKQDVKNGKGLCVIDPHGDLAQDVLAAVPKERADDIIYFNPADIERPFGLNMMEYSRPEEKTFVINEMINIFDKLYDLKSTGGPMFEQYMRNAMLLVMEDPQSGSTLMEIPKVLADEDFRKMKLTKCANPVVIDFWTKEAEKAGGEAALANMVPYITSKLTTFISNDMMRPIIAQQKSTINFRKVMDEGKILLINLSKGKVGEINSHLLGMVIVGKILMAALSRVDMPEEDRKDFYLYIDEFQNVTTDSIAQILSEARKYHLCLTIAHQFIGQLDEGISKAVFGNVGSMAAFRVGPEDGEFLEKQFEPIFTRQDLINVDNYKTFTRLLINNETSKPFNMNVYPPTEGNQEIANHLKELSRLKYGRDAKIVNQEILERTKLAGVENKERDEKEKEESILD